MGTSTRERATTRLACAALIVIAALLASLAPATRAGAVAPAQSELCAAADTPIGQVQGAAAASPSVGASVTVQGVVVGDYEGASGANLQGFYLQDAGDGDAATSDGIFVFSGNGNDRASLGQVVQVTGPVSEFAFFAAGGTQTQITATAEGAVADCGANGTVAPTELTLPVAGAGALEAYEGMLVRFEQTLYVTEHFQLGRFGQVVLAAGGRLQQPTSVVAPGAAAAALQAENSLRTLYVDDASYGQNPDPIVFARGGQPLSAGNTLRGGDSLAGLVGVLGQTDAASVNTSADPVRYRLRPIGALGGGVPNFTAANARPATAPAVGGTLKAAAFNVLNYFVTLDIGVQPNCGPDGNKQECRGANTAEELTRQRDKLLQALIGLDADVLGLIELENTTGVDPLGDPASGIVTGLNALAGAGTYAYLDTGTIGTDTIRVALIYKPAAVTPVGPYEILDGADDPRFDDSLNRPSLAQAFRHNASGELFVAVVNHLKSKGASGLDADPACAAVPPTNPNCDQGDGQGFWNAARTEAARALVDWLDATFADKDALILGDLNSYAREDPIATILAGPDDSPGTADDYANLVLRYGGPGAYSYVFDGQWGYLDHALASASLAPQVVGAAEWHINADEPSVLDFNTEFKSAGQVGSLYSADPFRTSDHDPVLVGMRLGQSGNGASLRLYLPLVAR